MLRELTRLFDFSAIDNNDDVAISNENDSISWGELSDKITNYKNRLSQLENKLVVGIELENGPEFSAWLIATLLSNHIAALIPHRLTSREREKHFESVTPDLLISPQTTTPFAPADLSRTSIQHLPIPHAEQSSQAATNEDIDRILEKLSHSEHNTENARNPLVVETALINFTSGTTGTPSAISLSLSNIATYLETNRKLALQDDRHQGPAFCPVPNHHSMGCALLLERLSSGRSFHVANSIFFGEHLNRIKVHNCVTIDASPNYFRNLILSKTFNSEGLPSITRFELGSDRIAPDLVEKIQERFPDSTIVGRYGLTEAFGALAKNTIPSLIKNYKKGDIGALESRADFRLVDSNTIPDKSVLAVKSPAVALGYWNHESSNLSIEGGFLRTGDLAEIDRDNRIIIIGRESQFIKSNGFRIDPNEIEDTIRQLDESLLVAAIGIEDNVNGQKIVLCVNSNNKLNLEEIKTHCRHLLSAHKIPALFYTKIDIPLTKSGKIARELLKQKVEALCSINHP